MDYTTDRIHHKTILALRDGTSASEQALIAHHTRGAARKMALDDALESADRVTAAAKALRAEIATLEADQAGEAAALRARQMNAELPADQRDVLLAKGMV